MLRPGAFSPGGLTRPPAPLTPPKLTTSPISTMLPKLNFDFEADLLGAAPVLGQIDWISSSGVSIRRVAAIKHKGFKGDLLVVDTNGRHGFNVGDQIYLEGVSPALNGFHSIVEHPIQGVDIRTCFAIEGKLNSSLSPRDGAVRWIEEHSVINPEFLPLHATTELGGLGQIEQMQMLEAVAPDAYAEMMQLLQTSAEQGEKKASEELRAMETMMRDGVFDGKPLDPSVLSKMQQIKDRRKCREIEIVCGMPEGLVSSVAGMRNAQQRVAQIYNYIVSATAPGESESESESDTSGNGSGKEAETKPTPPKRTIPKKSVSKESGGSGPATDDTAKAS